MSAQDLPDRARGARHLLRREVGRAVVEIVEDRLRTGCALQLVGGLVANLQDPLDDDRGDRRWRVVARPRASPQERIVLGSGAKTGQPLADPTKRAAELFGKGAGRPVGVVPPEGPQGRAIGDVVGFHGSSHPSRQ